MTATPEQLALTEAVGCRCHFEHPHGWRRRRDGGFEQRRYLVRPIPHPLARRFIQERHYSRSWPAARLSFGLLDGTRPRWPEEQLVGVLVLGVPMHPRVLTRPFPRLEPYAESLELSRLLVLDEVLDNAESFLVRRSFRLAARAGVRGVVAHSDPHPRLRRTGEATHVVFPGHTGTTYQASGMKCFGRTSARSVVLLPDATVLTDRAISKVRAGEPGGRGVERRLLAFPGAWPRSHGEPGGRWLAAVLDAIGASVLRHGGNYRYACAIGPNRTRVVIDLTPCPYPKRHHGGLGAPAVIRGGHAV